MYVLAECERIRPVLDGGYEDATGYYCPYELSGMCPHDTDSCEGAKLVTAVFEDTVRSVSYTHLDVYKRQPSLRENSYHYRNLW